MKDQRPPQVSGDERATLTASLRYLRDSVVRKVDGITDDDARRSVLPTGTSLLWLVRHLAYAEALWILERFAGGTLGPGFAGGTGPGDTLELAIDTYRTTSAAVDEIIATADLDQLCTGVQNQTSPDLRWVIVHLIEETARHAGHADVLRELLDGATGR